jgi:addiction module RelB/DinJ family antitoxin
MAKTTLLRARVDSKRKKRAERILRRYGLTAAQAINVFFAKVTEINGLPFDLRPSETSELLAEPSFRAHLGQMSRGIVKYNAAENIPA